MVGLQYRNPRLLKRWISVSSTRRRGGTKVEARARDEGKRAMISGAEQRIDKLVTKGRQMHVRKRTNA